MENDNCVYARNILGRLNSIIQSSGSNSAFEDAQLSNSASVSGIFYMIKINSRWNENKCRIFDDIDWIVSYWDDFIET